MRLIEEYNEEQTRSYLLKLCQYLKGKSEKKVSYGEIYGFLGKETVSSGYGIGNQEEFKSLVGSCIFFPQNNKKLYTDYVVALAESYNSGDYFQIRLSENITPNERMIINVNRQVNVFVIMRHLIQNPIAKKIKSMKFYGVKNASGKTFKYDKIVIYYHAGVNKENRIAIHNDICSLDFSNGVIKRELSGFYHIYDSTDSSTVGYLYPVGIGKEVSGTSFTTETTLIIQSVMTQIDVNTLKEKKSEKFDVKMSLEDENKAVHTLFAAGMDICNKFFNLDY